MRGGPWCNTSFAGERAPRADEEEEEDEDDDDDDKDEDEDEYIDEEGGEGVENETSLLRVPPLISSSSSPPPPPPPRAASPTRGCTMLRAWSAGG
jgi:hypothetical protein